MVILKNNDLSNFDYIPLWTKSSTPSFREMELTIHFPWEHFRPASITAKSEESMHNGTFEISGSDEIKLQNFVIAETPSNIPSSMLMSKTWAPFSTCNQIRYEVENFLKGSLDSIPSTSVKVQIMGGKVCLRYKGKTLLGDVSKLLKTKSFAFTPQANFPAHNLNFHQR